MILDLRSMYIAGSLTCLILGFVQLSAFASGRFDRWQAWWGASNILIGIGTLGIACRGSIPDLVSIKIANVSTLMGYVVLTLGIRAFAGRRQRWGVAVGLVACAMLPPLFLWEDPANFPSRVIFFSLVAAGGDAIILREGLRIARREGLASAWILVGLFSVTTLAFAVRAVRAMTGHFNGDNLFSPGAGLQQWFIAWAIAFITLRGNAVLLLAAERDRNLLMARVENDALTNVRNRIGLRTWVDRFALARNSPRSKSVALLLIDIDHFKLLNDTDGHAAGDRVLVLLAKVATSHVRERDIVMRHGGDEFVVVLAETPADEAVRVADRIRHAFADHLGSLDDITSMPTLSIGVALGDLASDSFESILKKADAALYGSKRLGRDRVHMLTVEEMAA